MITKIKLTTENKMIKKAQLVKPKSITTFICALSITTGTCFVRMSYADTANEQITQVYKTIAPDGSVTFSDTPTDNAQSIRVKPITTVPALSPIKNNKEKTNRYNNTSPKQSEISYNSFSFIQPENNSSFHSAGGTVQVILNLEPNLQSNNKIKILLDGTPIAIKQSLTHTLSNIARGTHTLTGQVMSHDNKILKSTSISFTLHRPSIKR